MTGFAWNLLRTPAEVKPNTVRVISSQHDTLMNTNDFQFRGGTSNVMVGTLPTVLMEVGSGVLFGHDGSPIAETMYLQERNSLRAPVKVSDLSEMYTPGNDPSIFITFNAGWRNYYHFLTQTCLSTYLAATSPPFNEKLFVFPELRSQFKEVISFLLKGRGTPLYLHKLKGIKADNVSILNSTYKLFASRPSPLLRELGDTLLSWAGSSRQRMRERRIYISRRDSKNRVMLNELELEAAVARRGFDVISLSGMSIPDQFRLFNSANYILAPHGAGLANLIACKTNVRVTELTTHRYQNPCFARMSGVLGLNYTVLGFEAADDAIGHAVTWNVDLKYLMRYLDEEGI